MGKLKQNANKFNDKYSLKIVLILIFMITILILLYTNSYSMRKIFILLFWNDTEKSLNFSVITIFVAVLTFIYTKKKFRADLVSQSRIKWIQDVREATADVYSNFRNFQIVSYKDMQKITFGEIRDSSEDAITELTKSLFILRLYFAGDTVRSNIKLGDEIVKIAPPNDLDSFTSKEISELRSDIINEKSLVEKAHESNKQILEILYKTENNNSKNGFIVSFLDELITHVTYAGYGLKPGSDKKFMYSSVESTNRQTIEKHFKDLTDMIAIYLKVEWERAKKGE